MLRPMDFANLLEDNVTNVEAAAVISHVCALGMLIGDSFDVETNNTIIYIL